MANDIFKTIETVLKQGKHPCVIYINKENTNEDMRAAWELSPTKTLIHFTESCKVKCIKQPLLEVVRGWDPRWVSISVPNDELEYDDEFDDLF